MNEETIGCEPTFLDRLKDESADVNYKISRLIEFLNREGSEAVPTTNQYVLLEMQLKYMKGYASCLNLRIDDLKE